jgi:LynF/TruF/PatF family peptide O-prenyltransferase
MVSHTVAASTVETNLRYFWEHKNAFEVENLYPLERFEDFVRTQEECLMDCSCKISGDQIHAARFTIVYSNKQHAQKQVIAAMNFFHQVKTRVGVTLDCQILEQFLGIDFDFNKIQKVFVGVDARTELGASKVTLFIWIEDYPEKIKMAIDLCGCDEREIRPLLISNNLLVGFAFNLDGRAATEIYPTLSLEQLKQFEIQVHLRKMLSPAALQLLQSSNALQIGFSQENKGKILYYHPLEFNNFVDNLDNEMAKRVHAYYRHQDVKCMVVCIPESELGKGLIRNLNMYYFSYSYPFCS